MYEILAGIVVLFLLGCVMYFVATHLPHNYTVKYDCRISEISPDFPPEVREACRKLRAQSGRI